MKVELIRTSDVERVATGQPWKCTVPGCGARLWPYTVRLQVFKGIKTTRLPNLKRIGETGKVLVSICDKGHCEASQPGFI